jgi:hypothetical protein
MMPCPDDRHVGPIFEHLVTTTRIELDPQTLKIKEDAVAETIEQFRDGWECEACGLFTSNPFHMVESAMADETVQSEPPWPPHPELTRTCEVCGAPRGFACVRKGTRWYRAPTLKTPHIGRTDA